MHVFTLSYLRRHGRSSDAGSEPESQTGINRAESHVNAEVQQLFDYVVVGGGTAGSIVASRLSEDPSVTVALIEAGPSDVDEPRAGSIRRWAEMLEGEYDLDYRSVPQARGNSFIRQARLRILGGCSTANTMISWRPLRGDLEEWAAAGVEGWGYEEVSRAFDRIAAPMVPVADADRNPYIQDAVTSAAAALDLPQRRRWNAEEFVEGAGFFEIGYYPENNDRASSSRAYLHDNLDRPNLTVVLSSIVERLTIEGGRVTGVLVRPERGEAHQITARREVVLSCGAIDTPALLQRSGIGPAEVLRAAGVEPILDLAGVGENLQDHAEGLVVWEASGERSEVCATGWDAGYVVRVDPESAVPDISTHIPLHSWTVHAERFGADIPANNVSLAPNVAKPRSRGRVWITSPSPDVAPSIDYGYFTDADGRDETMLVEGAKLARRVAQQEPFASHLVREVFPGPDVVSDEELSEVLRATHQTVYHVSCTARMGAAGDALAVVDSRLRVHGIEGLRIADASVFPTIPALNPVGTVMTVAERAVDFIREDAGAR
ncbi:choline oxidase [Pseudoclavibacter sp. AY1H1]|nr:choline oxidase [Pseudoclavibacter sp. AY1H1]